MNKFETLIRLMNRPDMDNLSKMLLKLSKRNKNKNSIKFYSNWIVERKKFRKLGKLTRQVNPPIEAYKSNKNNITISKIGYGLLFD